MGITICCSAGNNYRFHLGVCEDFFQVVDLADILSKAQELIGSEVSASDGNNLVPAGGDQRESHGDPIGVVAEKCKTHRQPE
jgi:hypothetical protein